MRNMFFAIILLIFLLSACIPNDLPVESCTARTETGTIYSTSTPPATNSISTNGTPATHYINETLVSPNEEFIANIYNEPGNSLGVLEIRYKSGKLLWQIPYEGELPSGDPVPSLKIFQWSNNNSHLYYYYSWGADGMEVAFWWTGYNLQKINIQTGEIEKILPDGGFVSFAISPDENQIAYFRCQDQPYTIYIRNLETGLEISTKVVSASKNYIIVGDIYWSPSSKEIVFQAQDDKFMIQTIYLNLSTMQQKIIKEYPMIDGPQAILQGWIDDGNLEYKEVRDIGFQIIHVNIETMQTTTIGTPTPNP